MTVWRGTCGVCSSEYEHPSTREDRPNSTFCPECREQGMMAPGVVNWKEYTSLEYDDLIAGIKNFFNVNTEEAEKMLNELKRGVG